MLKLQYTDGSQKGVWLIEPKQKLGADRKNDLVMAAQDVGDFHAEIHIEGESLRLEPLGGHACLVNGNRIAGATPIKLGDKIRLGSVELVVMDPRQQAKPAMKPVTAPKPAAASVGWALVAQQAGANNKRWPIKGTMVIGRATDCDISIAYDRMSRKHAELRESGASLLVRDLGSANGTFVNEKPVKEETRLKAGDKIRFDMLAFVVEGPGGSQEDLNKTVVRPAIDLAAIQQQAKAQKKEKPAGRPAAAPRAAARSAAGQPQAPAADDTAAATGGAGKALLVGGIIAALLVAGGLAWYFLGQ